MGKAQAQFGRRRVAGAGIALLLALGLTVSPPATGIAAAAADPLRVSADATYTLDPAAGRVHVAIQYQVTDLKPNTSRFIYYYTGYTFGIQREAKSIRASDSGGGLAIETKNHPFYIELTVKFRNFIYYRDTAKFTVRYDLDGGAPRSASSIRIGKAFATFGVWAWGDEGRSTIVVNLPQGFGSTIDGDPMSKTSSGGSETLRANPASPERFFAILSAENPLAYTTDRLSLEGGVEIVVMAWPEDKRWDDKVLTTLRTGLPRLRELIGLDWPVEHDLDVRERYTPALEGYAGVFFTDQQRIDVSEDLDPVTIVHEASHAWFNEDLFVERWIYEGLAQEYAWRVQQAVGSEDGGLPERPDPNDPGFVRLSQWTFPEVIRDQKTDDRERYGYQASFWVVHRLVDTVGVERMRAAFAAAHAKTTPYPGAGTPETASGTSGWKRFLDLVESLDRSDSTDTERSLEDFVLTSSAFDDLQERAAARAAYRELLDAGDGWLPGWYVRQQMTDWRFDVAEQRMTEARAVLDLRAKIDAAATALGLVPDASLKAAYEIASGNLDAATGLANDELAALSAIADAKTKVETEPDLLSRLGLLGSRPQAPYDAARAAFERGDVAGARASAVMATNLVADAAVLGQERLVLAIAVAVALLVLLVVLVALRRRRSRRIAVAPAAQSQPAEPGPSAPVAGEPYATLAADPDAAPPNSSEHPPGAEGGAATPL